MSILGGADAPVCGYEPVAGTVVRSPPDDRDPSLFAGVAGLVHRLPAEPRPNEKWLPAAEVRGEGIFGVFLSSANFTQRGQERNIEAGVLLHDPHFAEHLARQWLGLVEARLVGEWRPPG